MTASRALARSTFSNSTRRLLHKRSLRATSPSLGICRIARYPGNRRQRGRSGICQPLAIAVEAYGILQIPYNATEQTFAEVLDRAAARGMKLAINRPFGMGRMLYENRELTKAAAYGFILEKRFDGVVLSGTKSPNTCRRTGTLSVRQSAAASPANRQENRNPLCRRPIHSPTCARILPKRKARTGNLPRADSGTIPSPCSSGRENPGTCGSGARNLR